MPTRDSIPSASQTTHEVVTVIVDPVKYDTCTRGIAEEVRREQSPPRVGDSVSETLEKHKGQVGAKRESRGPAPDFTSIRLPT